MSNNNRKTTSTFSVKALNEIKKRFKGCTFERSVTKTEYTREYDVYLYIRVFYHENHKYIDECELHEDIFYENEEDRAASKILEYAKKEGIPIKYEEAGNTCFTNKYISCGNCPACVYDDDGFPRGCNA